MSIQDRKNLTPYWRKMMADALKFIRNDIRKIKRETVDPDFCLLPEDKQRMELKGLHLEALEKNKNCIRAGGTKGVLRALDTVWCHDPFLVFKKG
ncbi:MAG: hypothetical protein CO093_00650 [Alphaproteobacteria bacterium CG_4_9_14_3_um_filter_47_13]|nr:MAG: hypothetical protein CO093_00650 [Alphaproteobacteria bacterium CG_4_9_14_3_um_filter_47_13]